MASPGGTHLGADGRCEHRRTLLYPDRESTLQQRTVHESPWTDVSDDG